MSEKLNNWLTLIANLGVVAGIVFLALEVRQYRLTSEATAPQEIASHDFIFLESVLDSSILARATVTQDSGFPLSPLERSQLIHRQHLNFRIFEHTYNQYQKGVLDEVEWKRHELTARNLLAQDEIAQQMWTKYGSGFSSSFTEMLKSSSDGQ